ncbi:MAG TPA: hypothetical protein VMC43_00180 [Candidatus Paceibacterota bacterium]|nr:hypothetical protein [Candidatus Paceibacterota bacterium]
MKKFGAILLNALPVLVMIALIPFVKDDYMLAALDIIVIAVAFAIRTTKHDFTVLAFGFFAMIASEYLFVSTGVETFKRRTIFGLMPLWLPFLWAYGFVAIKRAVAILDNSESRSV